MLAAGFSGPIYASNATARLLPLVIEDALKLGVTRDKRLVAKVLARLQQVLVPLDYGVWTPVDLEQAAIGQARGDEAAHAGTSRTAAASKPGQPAQALRVRFQPAGHILGSAYIEFKYQGQVIVFSGDLGAPYAPLLPAPKVPWRADYLVLESTYGDSLHEQRRSRQRRLQRVIERALRNAGTVLIPAFSIGRTQELLYELESIIQRHPDSAWRTLDIIVDSPLAAKFTQHYRDLHALWDAEARQRKGNGRHPLSFEQLITIDSHQQHVKLVNHLQHSGRPAIVIAASGMCAGGRMVNYLKALLPDPRTDVLFVGYQAQGTPGRDIQRYGPGGGYVLLDNERIDIKAEVHTLGGYSAHADQHNLVNFVKRMRHKPKQIRLVHGDLSAKQALQQRLQGVVPAAEVLIAEGV